jgi:PrgI family protein
MRARIPLDIDLEDRLVYGLTPIHLAYAVLAGLGAMAVWSIDPVFAAVRILAVVILVAAGAVLAWGTFRGRPADEWIIDAALFAWSTRRFKWEWPASDGVRKDAIDDDLWEAEGEAA